MQGGDLLPQSCGLGLRRRSARPKGRGLTPRLRRRIPGCACGLFAGQQLILQPLQLPPGLLQDTRLRGNDALLISKQSTFLCVRPTAFDSLWQLFAGHHAGKMKAMKPVLFRSLCS